MKRIMLVLLAIVMLAGCSGLQIGGDNSTATQVLVSIATRNIACELSAGDPEVVRTLENLYTSLKTGTLSDDALAQLSQLTTDRPTLAADIGDLISLLGVTIDPTSNAVIGLDMLDEAMFNAIEKAWRQGIVMCRGV